MTRLRFLAIGLLLTWLPGWALAGDGLVRGGDGMTLVRQPHSFPIIISDPGSYKLKTNLVVPDANTYGIVITSEDVTLDLNGYAIIGPTDCTPLPCTNTGAGVGISSTSRNVKVTNGTVRGMGSHGITLYASIVDRVRAHDNGGDGINVGAGSDSCRVVDTTADHNGGNGIVLDDHCLVTGNSALSNGGHGFRLGDASVVIGNVSTHNVGLGIGIFSLGGGSVVMDNAVKSNVAGGIESDGTELVTNNALQGNPNHNIQLGGLVSGNLSLFGGAGIHLDGTGLATGNYVQSAGGLGLVFDTTGAYSNNFLSGNNGGEPNPQVSGGTEIGTNLCGVDTSCP